MKLSLPDRNLLYKTGEVDYYDWNYKFPIKYIQQYRFKRIVKLLGKQKYPILLEAGTGSGIFLLELSKHCEKLFACDIHPYVENIEKLLKHYNISDYQIKSQSIQTTDYPDNFFDAIVTVSVLEFVPDLQSALNEIKRILKKDGVFITICPMNSKFLDTILSFYSKKKPKQEFGESRKHVGKALEENFKILEKGYMIPAIGKLFPIYTHYKLTK